MLNLFCSDTAFNITDSTAIISHTDENTDRYGLVNSKILNYLFAPSSIRDERSVFIAGDSNNKRLSFSMFEENAKPYGQMEIYFDNNYDLPPEARGTTITELEDYCIKKISESVSLKKVLFNIIEYCFFFHNDSLSLPTITALETNLRNDATAFSSYVNNSLKVSATSTQTKFMLTNGRQTAMCYFFDWISFEFYVDTAHSVEIKVWMSPTMFLADYPNCIMTKVVCPCDPKELLDMTQDHAIQKLSESSIYSGEIKAKEVADRDHTGMVVFKTKYVNNAVYEQYQLPFFVFYKGKEPTWSQQRDYIRSTIVSMYPEEQEMSWRAILPNLFIRGTFFLVPDYGNRRSIGTTETTVIADLGITHIPDLLQKVYNLYPDFDADFLNAKGVLCNIAGSGLQIFAFPETSNDEDTQDLKELHPSYIAVDGTNSHSLYMSMITRKFSQNLSTALKIAQSDGRMPIPTGGEYTTTELNDREYTVFAVDAIEYMILNINSY